MPETFDDRQLRLLIRGIKGRVGNIQAPLRGFANYLVDETRKQFDEEVDPEGNPWAPLSPDYLQRKLKAGYPADILTRTGDMKKTIYADVTRERAIVGLKSAIASYHQEGTKYMPQRQIVGITEARLNRLRSLIRVYIAGRGR